MSNEDKLWEEYAIIGEQDIMYYEGFCEALKEQREEIEKAFGDFIKNIKQD